MGRLVDFFIPTKFQYICLQEFFSIPNDYVQRMFLKAWSSNDRITEGRAQAIKQTKGRQRLKTSDLGHHQP